MSAFCRDDLAMMKVDLVARGKMIRDDDGGLLRSSDHDGPHACASVTGFLAANGRRCREFGSTSTDCAGNLEGEASRNNLPAG